MKRGNLRLGIDLDGVVADFNSGWVERYNRDFGADLNVEQIVEWDAPTHLTHFSSMGEFWKWARTCGEGRSLFRPLRPYPDALESLRLLRRRGHKIVILTTKPGFAIHDTFAWLSEHEVPTTEVHILDDKTTVACDVYLDDADHNLEALSVTHPDAGTCRFVRPWNSPAPGLVDVESWAEFLSHVGQAAALRAGLQE